MAEQNTCKLIEGAEWNKFLNIFARRSSKFGMSPGTIAIIVWVILTVIYIVSFVYYEKSQFESKDMDEGAKKKSVAEGIIGYFALILPISLAVYAFGVYRYGKEEYQLSYPSAGWPGGIFWGVSTLVVLLGIVVGIILVQNWEGFSLSAFWIAMLVFMTLIVSLAVGALSHVLVECKLTSSPEYKRKFACAEAQILQQAQTLSRQARFTEEKAQELTRKAASIRQKLAGTENNADAVSRATLANADIGGETEGIIKEASRTRKAENAKKNYMGGLFNEEQPSGDMFDTGAFNTLGDLLNSNPNPPLESKILGAEGLPSTRLSQSDSRKLLKNATQEISRPSQSSSTSSTIPTLPPPPTTFSQQSSSQPLPSLDLPSSLDISPPPIVPTTSSSATSTTTSATTSANLPSS